MSVLEEMKIARERYQKEPTTNNLIWYGRRVAYTGDFSGAIKLYSEEIRKNPGDPRLFRHRGHRYISTRQFEKAIEDLEVAVKLVEGKEDEIEEDGIPNSQNIPLSTLFFNIYYHLGLAYYLTSKFEKSLNSYNQCRLVSRNDDSIVAASYWIYLIHCHLNSRKDATTILKPITRDMQIIENFSYYYLLLLFKNEMTEKDVQGTVKTDLDKSTTLYGLAMWHLFSGRKSFAIAILKDILANPKQASFGYIASEVEIQRFNSWSLL